MNLTVSIILTKKYILYFVVYSLQTYTFSYIHMCCWLNPYMYIHTTYIIYNIVYWGCGWESNFSSKVGEWKIFFLISHIIIKDRTVFFFYFEKSKLWEIRSKIRILESSLKTLGTLLIKKIFSVGKLMWISGKFCF